MCSPTFEQHLLAARPGLFRRCLKLTLDQDAAEDLVQDTFVRAIRSEERFDGSNLMGWLYCIARNHFLTGKRRARFDGGYVEDLGMAQLPSAMGNQHTTIELQDAMQALSEIPQDYREAVLLISSGASYEEAADELGIAVGTVKSRVARGRAMLEQLVAG